jgi:hypothetical protein
MVIYRSKLPATLKRNYQLMPGLKWLRLLMNHIPDKYEHLVRYYGYYSNRSRGARRLAKPASEAFRNALDSEAFRAAIDSEAFRNAVASNAFRNALQSDAFRATLQSEASRRH